MKVKSMENKGPEIEADSLEIRRIDVFSFVRIFTGIIIGSIILVLVFGLLFYYFIIRENIVFLPKGFAELFYLFTFPAILWCLIAFILISSIAGFFIAGLYNFIAGKKGGVVFSIKK